MEVSYSSKNFLDYCQNSCIMLYPGKLEDIPKVMTDKKTYRVAQKATDRFGYKFYKLEGFESSGFMPACWFEKSGIGRLFSSKR